MIVLSHLTKDYTDDEHALNGVSLTIPDGDIFGIIGMSGAGKSTLVRCVNLLEHPTSGTIEVDGQNIEELTGQALRDYRHHMAMIFQNFGLLSQRTTLQNVCFPYLAANNKITDADREEAKGFLERVGLADKVDSYPAQLSGGQKQRVAIARALACHPKYILCDEATSALDPASTASVLKLLNEINQENGITILVITHSMEVAEKICKHVAVLVKGKVVEEGSVKDVFANPQHHETRRLLGKEQWVD